MTDAAHDRWTHVLQGPWPEDTLLDLALCTLFTIVGGYLIVDDTAVEKP